MSDAASFLTGFVKIFLMIFFRAVEGGGGDDLGDYVGVIFARLFEGFAGGFGQRSLLGVVIKNY